MVLEVLKYILLVLGIVAVGAFIIWGLVSLILIIIEPHGNEQGTANNANMQERQITYEPQRLLTQERVAEPVYESYVSNETVQEVDEQKALEEEKALSQGTTLGELSAEEEEFIKEKQRMIEERLAAKEVKEETIEDEFDFDSIFIDDEQEEVEEETVKEVKSEETFDDLDEEDEDIEALINKILDGNDEEEVAEETTEQQSELEEETVEETIEDTIFEEEVEEAVEATEEETVEEVAQAENSEKIKELEELLEKQKAEYEERLKAMEEATALSKESDEVKAQKIAELEKLLAEKEAEKAVLAQEKEELAKQAEEKTSSNLSLEEYEARLETLRERLKNNEKDLKPVKKEYIPLAKIKARLEKDNVKLRRKEALVAKQKVVLYGVNNYVDIDEEKAKKLAEDLDLLEGLRLSVAHCEEVMKANEERFPILESAYNSLIETNTHLKSDIEECLAKIEEIKNQENADEE